MGTVESDWQPGFGEDSTVERAQLVWELHLLNDLRKGLATWHEPPVRDLKLWLPRFEKNMRAPQRSNEDQPLLRSAHTRPATKSEQRVARHRGASFLVDLAPQCVDPALARLGAPGGEVPLLAVTADQDKLITSKTHGRSAVRCPRWRSGRRIPGHAPILTVHRDWHLNTVKSDVVHSLPGSWNPTGTCSGLRFFGRPNDHGWSHAGT